MSITYIHFPTVSVCVFLMYVQCLFVENDIGPVMSIKGNVTPFSEQITMVKLGETVEVTCTNGNGSRINLTQVNRDDSNPVISYIMSLALVNADESNPAIPYIELKTFNDTSVTWVMNITEPNMAIACTVRPNHYMSNPDYYLTSAHILIGDSPINVVNFRCRSNNLVSLHCTWTTTCLFAGFKLYVIDNNERPSIICDIPLHLINSSEYALLCSWDMFRSPRYNPEAAVLNFTIEYCNSTLCLNETHVFDHLSIVKLNPPIIGLLNYNLNVIHNNIPTITFSWEIPFKTFILLDGVEHRIQYSKLGGQPHEANLLKFENKTIYSKLAPTVTFLAVLSLPCYDREYEIRVSVKTKQAVREEYWSDYRLTNHKTGPRPADEHDIDDATCSGLGVDETPEIMQYLLKKFEADFQRGQFELENGITKLTEKVARMDKHN